MTEHPRTPEEILTDCYRYFGLTPADGHVAAEAAYASRTEGQPECDRDVLTSSIEYIRWHAAANREKPVRQTKHRILSEEELFEQIQQNEYAAAPVTQKSLLIEAIAFPGLLALATIISISPLMNLFRGFQIWSHEFGHATLAWFTGYRAIPLPIGWTNAEVDQSWGVSICLFMLIAIFGYTGVRERKWWPVVLAVILTGLQIWMTWGLSPRKHDLLMCWSGVGGEFYLNTILICAFFIRMPEKFRWPVCRYIFLILCGISFSSAWLHWHSISAGQEAIPYGTLVGGADDTGGDMNRLRSHEWSEAAITSSYNMLRHACLAVIALSYMFSMAVRLLHYRKAKRNEALT